MPNDLARLLLLQRQHLNAMNPFAEAAAAWQTEIDTMAAFLLREGRAITPADALAKATITIHQKRRDAASARVPAHDHMGKTLAAEGGPLSGQGAPQ
jgi:hypothetical protein